MENKIKVAIIDDDAKSCEALRRQLVERHHLTVVGVAHNGIDGLNLIDTEHPTVVFLDVEMPDVSGLDLIGRSTYLREGNCRIVVYTAWDKYILPAMRRQAFDVLIKPFEEKELDIVVERLKTTPASSHTKADDDEDDQRYVLFTNSVDFTIVGRKDIVLFQYDSASRCWEAVVAGLGHPVRLRRNVKAENLKKLGEQYVQVHQRYIINADYLNKVEGTRCYFYEPFDNIDYVVVGRVYREKLLERFASL